MARNMNRGEFLKGAGVAAGALATSGMVGAALAAEGDASQDDIAWDYESEIVVCGFGGAGGLAAIQAYDNGAQVLVIEKHAADTDDQINNTCSARLAASCTMNFYSEEQADSFLHAASRGATPDDVIASWAKLAPHVFEYLADKLGVEFIEAPDVCEYPIELFPDADAYYTQFVMGMGEGYFTAVKEQIDARGIEVLYETPLSSLITNDAGEVIGVCATQGGKEVNIKASKAVILATGGFEFNEDMLNQYVYAKTPKFYGNPESTGDGIKAAQAIGADLWHMGIIGGRLITYVPDLGFGINLTANDPYILIDHYGKRFMSETWRNHSACLEAFRFSTALCDWPAIPALALMDQSTIDQGPIVRGGMLSVSGYEWSEDNSKEVEAGWVFKADTLEELAEQLNADEEIAGHIDPEVLAQTVADYNQYVADGADPDFERSADELVALSTPPYYAVKLYPGGVNTFGGPRRNANGQVMRVDGNPIPRLYEAGEMGSILGFLYAGGGWNFNELVVSAQIAANAAVEEAAWDAA